MRNAYGWAVIRSVSMVNAVRSMQSCALGHGARDGAERVLDAFCLRLPNALTLVPGPAALSEYSVLRPRPGLGSRNPNSRTRLLPRIRCTLRMISPTLSPLSEISTTWHSLSLSLERQKDASDYSTTGTRAVGKKTQRTDRRPKLGAGPRAGSREGASLSRYSVFTRTRT